MSFERLCGGSEDSLRLFKEETDLTTVYSTLRRATCAVGPVVRTPTITTSSPLSIAAKLTRELMHDVESR